MSTGPRMSFNHDVAWKQLKKKTYVATLRHGAVKKNDVHPTIVRVYRHGRFTGLRARRSWLNRVFFDDEGYEKILEQWLFASGFDTVEEWKAAARKMSGKRKAWRLFMVELLPEEK